MKTNRLILSLLGLTVMIQGTILYRQYSDRPAAAVPAREPVREAPDGVVVDLGGLHVMGSPDAELVMIEFADYECPFCARHVTEVLPELKDQYISTGRMRYAFANNPLAIHSNAVLLATAAICAGEQGRYWEMHDRLFAMRPTGEDGLLAQAEEVEIHTSTFSDCLAAGREEQIERDLETATSLGITGTPTFAVGRATEANLVRVETIVTGAQPLATFENVIDQARSRGVVDDDREELP